VRDRTSSPAAALYSAAARPFPTRRPRLRRGRGIPVRGSRRSRLHLSGGRELRGNVHTAQALRQPRRQQRRLHALSKAELFLERASLARRARRAWRSRWPRPRGLPAASGSRRRACRTPTTQGSRRRRPDAAVVVQDRDCHFGSDVLDHLDVTGVLRDIRCHDGHLVQGRVADQPVADLHTRQLHALAVLSPIFISSSPVSSLSSRIPNVR